MKKLLIVVLVLLAAASSVNAQATFYSLVPKDARSMGMGGTFVALPEAQTAFFGNPAAFAAKKASLQIVTANPWVYLRPTSEMIASAISTANQEMEPLTFLGQVLEDNGFGAGASMSIGYSGRGLGLGFYAVTDEYIPKGSLAEAQIDSDTQFNAVVGISVPLQLGGLRIQVGGDLRPFFRAKSSASVASVVQAIANNGDFESELLNLRVVSGFGLAADLGASLELGPFNFGLSIRDIAPPFTMTDSTIGALKDAGGSLSPEGTDVTVNFSPQIAAGLAFKPRFIKGIIDPAFFFEITDPIQVIKDQGSIFNLLHAGAEIKLLSFISLRGGINRGWLSVGAGLRLLILDLDAAVFTEELGALPGDNPRSGFALKAGIRF